MHPGRLQFPRTTAHMVEMHVVISRFTMARSLLGIEPLHQGRGKTRDGINARRFMGSADGIKGLENEGGSYEHSQEPVSPADVVGDHVRLSYWRALVDLARHHCPLSRCTPAAAISW